MPFVYLSAIIGALPASLHGESADDEILEPDLETCLLGRVCVSDKARGKNVFSECLAHRKGVNNHPVAHLSLDHRK